MIQKKTIKASCCVRAALCELREEVGYHILAGFAHDFTGTSRTRHIDFSQILSDDIDTHKIKTLFNQGRRYLIAKPVIACIQWHNLSTPPCG